MRKKVQFQDLQQYQVRDMRPDMKRELLESTGWMRDFEMPQLSVLSRYFDVYELPAQSAVFDEDSAEAYLAVVARGTVKIFRRDTSAESKEIASVTRGSAFGEISLIDGAPRSGSVTAVDAVTLLILTKAKMDQLAREEPKLCLGLTLKIARLMAQRLRRTTARLVEYLGD